MWHPFPLHHVLCKINPKTVFKTPFWSTSKNQRPNLNPFPDWQFQVSHSLLQRIVFAQSMFRRLVHTYVLIWMHTFKNIWVYAYILGAAPLIKYCKIFHFASYLYRYSIVAQDTMAKHHYQLCRWCHYMRLGIVKTKLTGFLEIALSLKLPLGGFEHGGNVFTI